jgi:hypothetical protein
LKHTVREIYLNHNLISDEGALALAETLKTAPWVSVVHLAGNNLSSRALKAFAEAMEVFHMYNYISIYGMVIILSNTVSW